MHGVDADMAENNAGNMIHTNKNKLNLNNRSVAIHECNRITTYDYAYYQWIQTIRYGMCNEDLLNDVNQLYNEAKQYFINIMKILYNKGKLIEQLYILQACGVYLEALRNYCLENLLPAVILPRIVQEYLEVSLNNLITNCIKEKEVYEKYKIKIRKFANLYLHQAEKRGIILPEQPQEQFENLLEEILIKNRNINIQSKLRELDPCIPSTTSIKKLLENTNKLIKNFMTIIIKCL